MTIVAQPYRGGLAAGLSAWVVACLWMAWAGSVSANSLVVDYNGQNPRNVVADGQSIVYSLTTRNVEDGSVEGDGIGTGIGILVDGSFVGADSGEFSSTGCSNDVDFPGSWACGELRFLGSSENLTFTWTNPNPGTSTVEFRGYCQELPVPSTGTHFCNVNGGVWGSAVAIVTTHYIAQDPTAALSADKTEVVPGGKVDLSWSSSNADRCTGENFTTGGRTSDSVTVTVNKTTTYTLTCENAVGQSESDSVKVTVLPGPTADLSADETVVTPGGKVTLEWTSTNADSCSGQNFNTGGSSNGSVTVTVNQTTTYTLTCENAAGGSEPVSVEVSVEPLPTAELRADESVVKPDSRVILEWSSTNADSCSGQNFKTGGSTQGIVPVTVRETTTYTLTCKNAVGQSELNAVKITVDANTSAGLVLHTPSASPSTLRPDDFSSNVLFQVLVSGTISPPPELRLVLKTADGESDLGVLRDDGKKPDFEAGDFAYTGSVNTVVFNKGAEGCTSFFASAGEGVSAVNSESMGVCFVGPDIEIGPAPLEEPEVLSEVVVEDSSTGERFRSDEVLVKFFSTVSFEEIRSIVTSVRGGSRIKGFLPLLRIFQVGVPTDGSVKDLRSVVSALEELADRVEYASPNHQLLPGEIKTSGKISKRRGESSDAQLKARKNPNDPTFKKQRKYLKRIRAPQAWFELLAAQEPLQQADIAILDTGVAHRRSGPRGRDFKETFRHGYDCVEKDKVPEDESDNGHGSQVVSVIAAGWDNQHKIAGLSMNRKYVAVRVKRGATGGGGGNAERRPDGFVVNMLCGFEHALAFAPEPDPEIERRAGPKVKVINVSVGTFDDGIDRQPGDPVIPSLKDAVKLAIKQGVVVVAAAGNVSPGRDDNALPYPAAYNSMLGGKRTANGLIVVGGSMKKDKLLKVKRKGDDPIESLRGNGVDLSAPGDGIRAIASNDSVVKSHGTSFSAALVSGTVALLRARFPDLSPDAVERIIITAAAVKKKVPGGRRLDMERALSNAALQ